MYLLKISLSDNTRRVLICSLPASQLVFALLAFLNRETIFSSIAFLYVIVAAILLTVLLWKRPPIQPIPGITFEKKQEAQQSRMDRPIPVEQGGNTPEKPSREEEPAARVTMDFMATISHEIRTPLHGILGMSTLLFKTPLTPNQKEHVQTIKRSGEHLLTLLDDILDISKLESGKLQLESLPVDIHNLVSSVAQLMKPLAEAKGLEFSTHIDTALPHQISGDPTRLRQILFNLVGNAIKYTKKGKIAIRLYQRSRPGMLEEKQIVLKVSDTGIGIPGDHHNDLFERFSQLDPSTFRLYGGSGLGLAVCHELVHMMGGHIEVDSEPGKGSCFTVSLPYQAARGNSPLMKNAGNPATQSTVDTPSPVRTNLEILLVDDNDINHKIMLAILEELGHKAVIAKSGMEAIKILATRTFDVILMDIQMPYMDGIMTTQAIRASRMAWRNIPVIALTAHTFEEQKSLYQTSGINGFVSKPVNAGTLAGQLAHVTSAAQPDPGQKDRQ